MVVNRKVYLLVLLALAAGLTILVACGGSEAEPTAEVAEVDGVATSVRQTVEAIAVAQTVAALTTPGTLPTPDVQPTAAILPTSTSIVLPSPTVAPPTAQPPTAIPPTAVPPTAVPPTIAPPTATATRANLPPSIDNDAPGGSFPEPNGDHVFFNIIVDPNFLFRMDVRDLRVGNFEGAGIREVTYFISGEGVDYSHDEQTAGFCVFGGGEPVCNPWPRNDQGQLTWGAGGPVVQSGEYFVNMTVESREEHDNPDQEFGGFWNWNFNFRVTVP